MTCHPCQTWLVRYVSGLIDTTTFYLLACTYLHESLFKQFLHLCHLDKTMPLEPDFSNWECIQNINIERPGSKIVVNLTYSVCQLGQKNFRYVGLVPGNRSEYFHYKSWSKLHDTPQSRLVRYFSLNSSTCTTKNASRMAKNQHNHHAHFTIQLYSCPHKVFFCMDWRPWSRLFLKPS